MKARRRVSHPKKRAFLEAYRWLGNVSAAAEVARINRRSHHRWMKEATYAAEFAEAIEDASDRLEAEARRRALYGVEEPVFQHGQQVGVIRRYSDTLLIFLMKGAMPEKYRERYDVRGQEAPRSLKVVLTRDVDDLDRA